MPSRSQHRQALTARSSFFFGGHWDEALRQAHHLDLRPSRGGVNAIHCAALNLLAGPGGLPRDCWPESSRQHQRKERDEREDTSMLPLSYCREDPSQQHRHVHTTGEVSSTSKYKGLSAARGRKRVDEGVNCQHLETRQLEEPQTKRGISPTAATNNFIFIFL